VSDCEELVGVNLRERLMYSVNVLIFWVPASFDETFIKKLGISGSTGLSSRVLRPFFSASPKSP